MGQLALVTTQLTYSATAQVASRDDSVRHQCVSHLVKMVVSALDLADVFAMVHLLVPYARQKVRTSVHAYCSIGVVRSDIIHIVFLPGS